jgi:hypothetical protein
MLLLYCDFSFSLKNTSDFPLLYSSSEKCSLAILSTNRYPIGIAALPIFILII